MNPAIINTLLKFNSGKNAKAITASGDGSALEPGVHAVSLTVTIEGTMSKAPDNDYTRTSFPKGDKAFEIALSKVNAATRAAIVEAVKDVQRGGTFVPPDEVAAAMADLTQTTTASRKGAAVFGGSVVVEDCDGIRIGGFDMGKSNKR
tara:strand:+ start:147 stop:590 length:444 start_codon:yes stop_codon:yes gene_type:complete